MPQSQAAANPWHQEEEKKDRNKYVQDKQTNAREAHRPTLSVPSEVGGHNAKQDWKNTRTNSKERLN